MNYNKKIVVVTELALLTIFSVALTAAPLYPASDPLPKHSRPTVSQQVVQALTNVHPLRASRPAAYPLRRKVLSVWPEQLRSQELTKITGTLPSYTAEGVVQINLCPGGLPGALVTISGTCGAGTITFTSGTGSGTYKGYSICR